MPTWNRNKHKKHTKNAHGSLPRSSSLASRLCLKCNLIRFEQRVAHGKCRADGEHSFQNKWDVSRNLDRWIASRYQRFFAIQALVPYESDISGAFYLVSPCEIA